MTNAIVYSVKVVREPGKEPISRTFYDYAEEELEIEALSKSEAYKKSHLLCNIRFRGQVRRTFINGEEYFDDHY